MQGWADDILHNIRDLTEAGAAAALPGLLMGGPPAVRPFPLVPSADKSSPTDGIAGDVLSRSGTSDALARSDKQAALPKDVLGSSGRTAAVHGEVGQACSARMSAAPSSPLRPVVISSPG